MKTVVSLVFFFFLLSFSIFVGYLVYCRFVRSLAASRKYSVLFKINEEQPKERKTEKEKMIEAKAKCKKKNTSGHCRKFHRMALAFDSTFVAEMVAALKNLYTQQ